MDVEGSKLPTLVYLAREKRPEHPHNFKAGAMNALVTLQQYMLRNMHIYTHIHIEEKDSTIMLICISLCL